MGPCPECDERQSEVSLDRGEVARHARRMLATGTAQAYRQLADAMERLRRDQEALTHHRGSAHRAQGTSWLTPPATQTPAT